MNDTMQDILYLVRCVLNNQMPNINQLREPEREKILKLARAHSLIAMIVTALEQAGEKPGQMWLREREKAVRKSILFDAEYQRIADYMEQQGIWHMPLKGRILQNLYRQKGMRQMADVDLLFDEKYREQMQQFMLQSGYTVKCFEQGNHDVYVKPPVYNFEFHVSLYGDVHEESFKEYYKNIHHRLHHVEGKMQELCFRPEDFYIYFVSHMYKHYMGSGTGIRSLADCYLLLIKEKDTLDWHYIKEECQKLNVEEFEFQVRQLCFKLFGGENVLTEEENEMLEVFLFSGTYGTMERRVKQQVERLAKEKKFSNAKFVYIRQRLFPGRDVLEVYCPLVKKSIFFIPYAWAKRVCLCICKRGKKISQEILYLQRAGKK